MNIVIRVDASLQMGSGHVMRCLTLADGLVEQGAEVQFICRNHPGHLMETITAKGYFVFRLEQNEATRPADFKGEDNLFHVNWLGASQKQDAQECIAFLEEIHPDWLIVDHYAIDYRWHRDLSDYYKKLMVIDDLADRQHECDILLDQTFARKEEKYRFRVPKNCQLLLGSKFALLRPEFVQWREYSLKRRAKPEFKQLLITMGGVDSDNVTGQVLQCLNRCELSKDLKITVIMGETAPYLEEVKRIAQTLPYETDVRVNVHNMAELMANADLVLGAAGTTSWERCCLGVPTIMVRLADNQRVIADNLKKAKAAFLVEGDLSRSLPELLAQVSFKSLSSMSQNAAEIVDGLGCHRVVKLLVV